MMNCISMPTMMACQFTALQLREVAQRPVMRRVQPGKQISRFARVLSALSLLTKTPIKITATTKVPPVGSLDSSGITL